MMTLIFLFLVLIGLTLWYIHRNRLVTPLLTLSLAIYVFFWNVFPILYSLSFRYRTNNIVDEPAYLKIVIVQLATLFCVLVSFNILTKFRVEPWRSHHRKPEAANANAVLVLLSVFFALVLFSQFYSIWTIGFTFLERVKFIASQEIKEDALGAFLNALSIFILSFAIACLFSRNSAVYENRWIRGVSVLLIITYVAFMVSFGVRAFMILPILLLIIHWWIYKPKLTWISKIGIISILLALLVISPFLSISIRTIRALESYDPRDFLKTSPSELAASVGEYGLSVFDDLYTKFNSFDNGIALLEFDGGPRAGLSLITSSLTAAIPRILYPSKPVPFSIDREYSGIPYYLVPTLTGFTSPGNVVPITPSAIALWGFGYMGILLMIVFNVVNLLFVNILLKSRFLLYATTGFLLLSLPTFEFLVAPTGWIIKEGTRVLAVIFLAKSVFWAGRVARKAASFQQQTENHKLVTTKGLH
jgi:hypothetical protein